MKIALVGIGKIALDQHVPAIAASPDWELAATVSRNDQVFAPPGALRGRNRQAQVTARLIEQDRAGAYLAMFADVPGP